MIPVDPKPFQKINKTIVASVIFAGVVFAGVGYFFSLEKAQRQDVASLTKEIAVLTVEESQANKIKKQLSETDAKRSVLVSYFVDVNNPVPFEEAIENYGLQTNTKVNFEGLEVKKSPKSLNSAISVSGNFTNIYRFLALLESAPYELSVTNLDLQSADAGLWKARISLSVYSVNGI